MLLNNPIVYARPSGEWWQFVLAPTVFSALIGAAKASTSDQNVLEGALIGAGIGAARAAAGYGVGLAVTTWLPGALGSATGIVGATAGEFAGGLLRAGVNSAVYGGNVWQSALYGGLAGAALARTVQGIVGIEQMNMVSIKDPATDRGLKIRVASAYNILAQNEHVKLEFNLATDNGEIIREDCFSGREYLFTRPVERLVNLGERSTRFNG